jgi:hypothetical protein
MPGAAHSAASPTQRQGGDARGSIDESIDRTLESIRRQGEGEGGKLPPNAPGETTDSRA